MIEATDLKNGTTFLLEGMPYKVEKYRHQKIARGGGRVKLSLRNLETGDLEEKTLNSSVKVEGITTIKKPMKFLYKTDKSAFFVDNKTYEQTEIPLSFLDKLASYLNEGQEVDVLFWSKEGEDRALSVDIPPKVTLKVKETAPGAKGDSATNVYKPATLENGLRVKVPLFIKRDDRVVVDTRTGEYVERAKN